MLASQGSPRGCVSFEETLQRAACAMGAWELLLHSTLASAGFVASLGRLQLTLPWDWNAPLPAVDPALPTRGRRTAELQLPPGLVWWLCPCSGGRGELGGCVAVPLRLGHTAQLRTTPTSRAWGAEATADTSVGHELCHLWLPLRIPVLPCLLTDSWPSLLAPAALPAVVIPCLPEAISCAVQDEGF